MSKYANINTYLRHHPDEWLKDMKRLRILLLIETSRSFGRGILEGIAKYSHLYGPWRFFNELEQERLTVSQIRKLVPNGIFAQANEAKNIKDFLPANVPAIIIAGNHGIISGAPNIASDWKAEGELAAQHLLERGFKHFAYCGFEGYYWSAARGQAFETAIKAAGYKLYHYESPTMRYGPVDLESLCKLIISLPKPIGLLACNDDRARHVLEACQLCEIPVPEQAAILGIDNDPLRCDMADPPLSSIALNVSTAGFEAAKLMDHMIRTGKKSEKIVLVQPSHVQVRQSTEILAVEDATVATALRYIRINAKKYITVDEIAEAACESRRNLERRFRKTLNRSIMQCVRKERVHQISQLLISTKEPVSKIATDFEMCSFAHFADYFKKEAGLTPREFRKKYDKA